MMNVLCAKVESLQLSDVMERVKYNTGMDEEMALKAENLYRKFLKLKALYPTQTLVPPKLADEVWHEHIMSTEQYMQDCEQLFGEFLHHKIDLNEEKMQQAWQKSQHLYQKEFGIDLIASKQDMADCAS